MTACKPQVHAFALSVLLREIIRVIILYNTWQSMDVVIVVTISHGTKKGSAVNTQKRSMNTAKFH